MTKLGLADFVERATTLHDALANCHPSLTRGQVWCRSCGRAEKVDSAECLRTGWPKCCGATMTIDAPAALRAKSSHTGGRDE